MKPPYAIGSVPGLSGHAIAYRWRLSLPRIPEYSWASLPSYNARICKPRHVVRVCVFSSKLFWTSSSLDVPAGVTEEEGHTGFLIHLPSAVRALIFLARRIQPFFFLVDREVEFCDLIVLHLLGIFYFLLYFFFSEKKIPFTGIRTHVPTCQKVTRLLLSYWATRLLSNVPKSYPQFAASLITSHARAPCPHRLFAASLLQTFPHDSHARGESIHRLRHIFSHL